MAKPKHQSQLIVRSARYADVYKDTIRIAEADRGPLRTGRIHRFKVGTQVAYAVLRGLAPSRAGQILMDEATRDRLEATYGTIADITVSEAGFWGHIRWGWDATDPTYATATRLGVLSFGLGVLSLVLALPTVVAPLRSAVELLANLFC